MKHLPKVRKCPHCHKTRFDTREQARYAMMRTISHDPHADMFDLHTYPCEHSGGWHFGHKKYFNNAMSIGADQ